MARLLFVVWNDSPNPAQFSVPPDCTLTKLTSEPVDLEEHTELGSFFHAEFMLDPKRVRTAYMIDVPDGVQVNRIDPLEVETDEAILDGPPAGRYAEPFE